MRQFCARQPDACEVGSAALTQFGHKAQASALWLYAAPTETHLQQRGFLKD